MPTCSFGTRWPCGPCRQCLAESDRLERQFWRRVFFGEYDRDGFTPTERKAQAKQEAA